MPKHSDPPARPLEPPRLIRRHLLVRAFCCRRRAKCLPDTSVSSLCSLLGAPCSYDPAKSFWEGTSHTLFYGCILLETPSTVYLQVNKNALLFASLLIKHRCTKQPRGTQTPPFHFFFFLLTFFGLCPCVRVCE